jgi:hypothetical protein
MIQIGDKLISLDLFREQFHCNLSICSGSCCILGDSGAPLMMEEADILLSEADKIEEFLSEEGNKAIAKQGYWITDIEDDLVTPLIEGEECAYTVFENGIANCGIEKAFLAGKINFRKPISCHLYPIRLSKVGEYTALNYHRWPICKSAVEMGNEIGIPVFRFLKDSIIRMWGDEFYQEMEIVYNEMIKSKMLSNTKG